MDKQYYEVDENTGELVPTSDVVVVLCEGDQVRRKSQIEYCKATLTSRNDNGNFVWLLFTYGENLFPNISAANLTRLIYAATFCNQDGSIMSKSDLRKKMKLNRTRWSEFWNEMIANDVLYEQNDIVYVNNKFIITGKTKLNSSINIIGLGPAGLFCGYVINGKINTDYNYTRLFCEYIQSLYEGCGSANEHKQLSYIFKIIPFINRRTNVACMNPMEQDSSKIQTMKLGDFCDAIGYDKTHAKRLAKDLLNIRINGELAIGFFVTNMDEKTWRIVVNPKIYFGGKYDSLFIEYRTLFIKEAQEYNQN